MKASRGSIDRAGQTWVDLHPQEGDSFFVTESRDLGGVTVHDVILLSTTKSEFNARTAWFEYYDDRTWETTCDMRRIA